MSYVEIHMHDDNSNINMVEVVTKFEDYVKQAKEWGLPTVIITNHGVITGWYNRKKLLEQNGMKYVHAVEAYVTWTTDKKVRDNFHLSLYARNFEGFKELNKLISQSFDRVSNNFYYNPRISWDAIKNTSDNIIVSTACLGGFMNKLKDDDERYQEILEWIDLNKHRVFLEVQPHTHPQQVELNRNLANLAKARGWRLIAGGDVHALNELHDKARKILQKSKKVIFSDEDTFDLTYKSYEDRFVSFVNQGALTTAEINEAMNNTLVLLDMVEPFELDYSKKYPKLYDNPKEVLTKKIAEGVKLRGIDKLPLSDKRYYAERIKYELETYAANEAEDYLLLEDLVKTFARDNNIPYGYGRGSVSGSIIAYLLQITHMDSIKRNLNFERFMNKDRISLADVDSDYSPNKRHLIQKFLMEHPQLYCAPIMTANTMALKGAIRDMGRGMEIPLDVVDDIAKNVEENEEFYRGKFPELFKYVDVVQGVITSVGQHACGIAVSPIPLDENMGLITTTDSEYPLTMLNMKEIDAQNYVKLDILGLDTTQIVHEASELAGIEFPTPQTLDSEDSKVWDSIIEDNIGIFQWESDFAGQVYKDLFSRETIAKIKERNPNFSYIDLFSLGNAILRPSGASYRDSVMQGEYYDNGHEALNEFLSPTLGRLVYQEQQMEFLVKFCGYTGGQADLIRRAIGKKSKQIMDEELPNIEKKFIETMMSKYNVEYEKAVNIAKPFMEVFVNSANYGFSVNHSDAYSWFGYATAWLRYYYPLEFITASLNVNIGKEEKTAKLVEYAKSKGIEIKPIKFRYSKAGYMCDKETNAIYQGIEPIKFLNANVADELYKLRDGKFESFIDLLIYIKDNVNIRVESLDDIGYNDVRLISFFKDKGLNKESIKGITQLEKLGKFKVIENNSISVNSRQMQILIGLGFFSEFGGSRKLLKVFEVFEKYYNPNHKFKTKIDRYAKCLQFEQEAVDEELSLIEQCTTELEFLGHIKTVNAEINRSYMMLIDVKVFKSYIKARGYQFATGEIRDFKLGVKKYSQVPIDVYDVVHILDADVKPKNVKVGGSWQKSPTEKEFWIKELQYIRKGK